MTRLTLAQQQGLRRYRDVQTHADSRAEVVYLAERRAYRKRHPVPSDDQPLWITAAWFGIACAPSAIACWLFLTDAGNAALRIIWSY